MTTNDMTPDPTHTSTAATTTSGTITSATATRDAAPSRPARWAITGASQGFGRALTDEVLRRGHDAIAVVRSRESLDDVAAEVGDRLTVLIADLRDPEAVTEVGEAIAARDLDVLVNNAGRAIVGAVEEISIGELREQLELNFFAAAALTRAVLPTMRSRARGAIVQMSSQGGRVSFPAAGAYSASKFALEGWSEALAAEVRPLGVGVMLVEPSRFRTGFNTAHSLRTVAESGAYAATVGPARADLTAVDGRQEGDPVRAARIIVDLVEEELANRSELPLRLPLGAEAVRRLRAAYSGNAAEVDRWAEVAASGDFPGMPPSRRAV
ncbi:oxidoreductase [Brevibacterium ammoniilyticum]|uniref:Oxidoreductase n=1 Tax=Brevibacterium ammoniilyticum TaxID=1046555 RepID=A0ABP9U036_9MICO